MTSKIGPKEAIALLLIYSLMHSISALVGLCANTLVSGAIINHCICFVIALLMLKGTKKYYESDYELKDLYKSQKIVQRVSAIIIFAIFFFLFIFSAFSGLNIVSSQISSLTFGSIDEKSIRAVISLSSIAIAFLGMEALTRHSYIILLFGYVILAIVIYSSMKGWSYEGIFPLFGESVKRTFTTYHGIGLFSCAAPFLFLSSFFKSKKDIYLCVKKTLIISFALTFLLILTYILTVPYPIGKLYSHTLEALFCSGSSGDILHRFEIFLIALYTLFCVISLSFNTIICANIINVIFRFEDNRAQTLLIGVIIGCLSGFGRQESGYVYAHFFLALLAFLLPLFFSLCRCKLKRREKR